MGYFTTMFIWWVFSFPIYVILMTHMVYNGNYLRSLVVAGGGWTVGTLGSAFILAHFLRLT